MSPIPQRIIAYGAISAALAVAIGAFGAHALDGRVSGEMLDNYETGARYHFYHSLGMLAVGLFALWQDSSARNKGPATGAAHAVPKSLRWAALLMLTGIVLFSGSLYTMALTDLRWLGAVTPLGGIAFLGAWALLAWEALAATRGGRRAAD